MRRVLQRFTSGFDAGKRTCSLSFACATGTTLCSVFSGCLSRPRGGGLNSSVDRFLCKAAVNRGAYEAGSVKTHKAVDEGDAAKEGQYEDKPEHLVHPRIGPDHASTLMYAPRCMRELMQRSISTGDNHPQGYGYESFTVDHRRQYRQGG